MMNRLLARPAFFLAICFCAAPAMAQNHIQPALQIEHVHTASKTPFQYLDMPAQKKSKYMREAVETYPPSSHVPVCTRADSKTVQRPKLYAPMV